MERRFLTLSEVAEHLGTTVRQVYALVRSGELRALRVGGRSQWRVPEDALREYIARFDDDGNGP